jgi:4-diphosphocytidyl-2-C-methyl-D-erythritol kinase
MCCVGLHDIVTLDFNTEEISVICSHPQVPQNQTNLAYRAAERFIAETGGRTGVRIHIEKQIPVGAGLGGGSSNAATVLLGFNRQCGNPLSQVRLMQLGAGIGADVPFFIHRKPAIASGIGEVVESYSGLGPYSLLLVFPGFSLSTAEMFKNLNLRLTKYADKFNIPFFKNGNFDIQRDLHNDFEGFAMQAYPELAEIKNVLLDCGAMGALLSGSGSAVYGIFRNREIADRACAAFCRKEGWQIFKADLIL